MKRLFQLLAAAVLLGLTSGAANAQTIDSKLRGVNNYALVFQDLDVVSGDCGITKKRLSKPIVDGTSGLPIVFDGSVYSFEVKVVTLRSKALCFSSVDVTVYRFEAVKLRADPKPVHAKVIFWGESTILATTSTQHGREVARIMGDLVKEFVNDWAKDNS
jgi:hypothetical protein